MQVDGSIILLTGASSGIGEALAPMLAERGATVGIVARRKERLEATLERCLAHAPRSRLWVADLADVDGAVALVHEAWEAFGHLDCLINNAGVGKRKLVLDTTPDDLDTVMTVNFLAPVRMNLAVLPRMIARGSGTIVNVASPGGRFGIAHESVYCASKFALSGWSEVAAMDLADTPVEVKLVQPGAIATEIWDQRPGELAGLPGAPFVSAEECAAGVVEAIETPGLEFFVPADIKAHVDMKNGDLDGWIELMAAMGRSTASGT
ncbi:MAG TPA: SDR family NAD(P)-dependent oxidoreductase [Acidimicrobiales bacterium]|nr:SDR family NAD(P)-dependent oxidoreductase [Acidimicrobiales bacterium]